MSSHDRNSLHEFLFFFPRSFRLCVAQTQWVHVGGVRFIKLFLASSYGRSSWTRFFFGGGGASCYDSSYLGEFLCLPEVIGIVTKLRFCDSWVIAKKNTLKTEKRLKFWHKRKLQK